MITDIVRLLVDTLGALVVGACLLRLWLQSQRIGMRSPVGEFTMALTDWIVKPLRRIVPGTGGIDCVEALIAAYLVSFFAVCVLVLVSSLMVANPHVPGLEVFFGLGCRVVPQMGDLDRHRGADDERHLELVQPVLAGLAGVRCTGSADIAADPAHHRAHVWQHRTF